MYVLFTVQSIFIMLYFGSIGMQKVIKVTFLQRKYRKMTISIIPLSNFHGNKYGSHMTMMYTNQCDIEMCYKGTALYEVVLLSTHIGQEVVKILQALCPIKIRIVHQNLITDFFGNVILLSNDHVSDMNYWFDYSVNSEIFARILFSPNRVKKEYLWR